VTWFSRKKRIDPVAIVVDADGLGRLLEAVYSAGELPLSCGIHGMLFRIRPHNDIFTVHLSEWQTQRLTDSMRVRTIAEEFALNGTEVWTE
jgi:hypothetical protein